jgi:hypothetical protein
MTQKMTIKTYPTAFKVAAIRRIEAGDARLRQCLGECGAIGKHLLNPEPGKLRIPRIQPAVMLVSNTRRNASRSPLNSINVA